MIQVAHSGWPIWLAFISGFGIGLILSNYSLPGWVDYFVSTTYWITYNAHIVAVCITVGFAVWARKFQSTFSRPSRSLTPPVNASGNPLLNPSHYAEISADDIKGGVILHSFPNSSRRVIRINNIVVKYGLDLDLAEAASMIFIQERTKIPLPKILNAYRKEGYGYIIMEFVEGELLQRLWPKLLPDEKRGILTELKDYICQIRRIKCPAGTQIGSVMGGPAIDRRQLKSITGGPFTSVAEFNKWQLAQLREKTPLAHRDIYITMHKPDRRIVFSHCDLGFHNIIVHNGHIAAIIDWEDSGWYPEHWDYCKAVSFLCDSDELYSASQEIFEERYQAEHLMDTWFGRSVRHGF